MRPWKDVVFSYLIRSRFGEKLLMTANIWCNDWRIGAPSLADNILIKDEREKLCREAEELYSGLDEGSRKAIERLLWRSCYMPDNQKDSCCFFYNLSRHFTPDEIREDRQVNKLLKKLRNKYDLNNGNIGAESLVYHHGLSSMPEKVLFYIKGKDFVDAGACFGDSTLVFANYVPRKIYAFEPSPENGKIFRRTMDKNRIPEIIYELVPMGLASQKGEIFFSDSGDGCNDLQKKGQTKAELITLDEFVRERKANIGVIKADLEGMGLDMLKGAKETLVKCRPVLSISIYHNNEELFGIYPFLKELLPDYHFYIRCLSLPFQMGEVSLLGYPKELLK